MRLHFTVSFRGGRCVRVSCPATLRILRLATDLTTGPVAAHLRRQATPFAVGLIALISFDAVDLFFVSRLGDQPLAAISFTFQSSGC